MVGRVVVIGGGITGVLSAVRLARAGFEVVLVEAHHIGAGSSSRTAAGIRQQFSTPETVLGMRYAVDVYRRFPEEVGGLISPIVENGYLFLLEGGLEAARSRVAMQKAQGLAEVELLTADETVERFSFVDGSTIVGATWCPSDGFLRPEVVYGEAAASARAYGVDIRQQAPVTDVRVQGDRIVSVRAGDSWVSGDVFVDATNAWSPRLAQVLGAEVLPVSPVRRYLWFIGRGGDMAAETLVRMPMVVTPAGAYCHPENAETLMTGWAHDAAPEPEFAFEDQDRIEPAFHHKAGVDGRAVDTWMTLSHYLPAVGEFKGIHATTCGMYAVTPDHNPFLSYDRARTNLIRAVGFSGHGAMFGPFSALTVHALVEAGRNVDSVHVLGREANVSAFRTGRSFHGHTEALVI